MATSSTIVITPQIAGQVHVPNLTDASAKKASELLQQNHDKHHMYFNEEGFHNHIVHHLLVVYGFGASPEILQRQFNHNAEYQRASQPLDDKVVIEFADPAKFKQHLGNERSFRDYMIFFQKEINKKGIEGVIKEYLLKGDEQAEDLLMRLFAGFLHPVIHLGYGIEFKQPAIVAEALAQAATHDDWIGKYLFPSEEASKNDKPGKSLLQLRDEAVANDKLRKSPHWEDLNKVRDGIMVRAPEEMIKIAAQWKVKEDELEERMAEMMNFCAYFTAAAQNPAKEVKFDFFLMHCMNSSTFFPEFLALPWLSNAEKARLLEWKGRMDLALYVSRRSPKLDMNEVRSYKSKKSDDWNGLFQRATVVPDDGHAPKLIRALANGERVMKKYEDKEWCTVKNEDWVTIGNMVLDSVEGFETKWVRSAGFKEAWDEFKDRPRAQL